MTEAASQSQRTDPAVVKLRPGDVLHGTYRILGLLARGGMGEVHLAAHERLPGHFAIKVPHAQSSCEVATLSRFETEARLLATLKHPNIVQVLDFNTTGGMPYLVMELVDGATLRARLRRESRLSPGRVANIIVQLAGALQSAHEQGIVHLDLKLENVMLTSCEGHPDFVKLLDFGIARPIAAAGSTFDDVMAGTPQFMAPEQIDGGPGDVDDRADQFALAGIAHTLLSGKEPFRGDNLLAVLYQVLHEEAVPLTETLGASYEGVSRVVQRALSKDPVLRFATIAEFATTLSRAVEAGQGESRALARAA